MTAIPKTPREVLTYFRQHESGKKLIPTDDDALTVTIPQAYLEKPFNENWEPKYLHIYFEKCVSSTHYKYLARDNYSSGEWWVDDVGVVHDNGVAQAKDKYAIIRLKDRTQLLNGAPKTDESKSDGSTRSWIGKIWDCVVRAFKP